MGMQMINAGIAQWADVTKGGNWMGWNDAKVKYGIGVQCKGEYGEMMGGIVGEADAEKWREGWKEVEEEEMECDRELEAVVAARKTPKELGEWEYLVRWKEGGNVTWETAEMMKTVKDKGVKKEMEKARGLPMAKSMRERIVAKGMEKRMETVLAGRAGPGDTEDRGAVMLWQQLCAQARDMGGGKGEELRGRREQEEGERWDPSEGIEAHGPGIAIKRH